MSGDEGGSPRAEPRLTVFREQVDDDAVRNGEVDVDADDFDEFDHLVDGELILAMDDPDAALGLYWSVEATAAVSKDTIEGGTRIKCFYWAEESDPFVTSKLVRYDADGSEPAAPAPRTDTGHWQAAWDYWVTADDAATLARYLDA